MDSGAADVAEIVSDKKTKLPDLDAPPRLDGPEQARFRLFDSITAFLKTASRRKPSCRCWTTPAISTDLGMQTLMERMLSRREILKA